MSWTRPTLNQIIDRIEKDMEWRLNSRSSLLKVAFLRVLAHVFAGAIHIAYGFLALILKQLLPDSATGEWLNRHAYIWGVVRKAASFSSGNAIFTGTDDTIIPKDTTIQTEEGVEYYTSAQAVVANGFALVEIQAAEAGIDGNISISKTLEIISPIVGIEDIVHIGIYELPFDNFIGTTFSVGETIENTDQLGVGLIVAVDTGLLSIILQEGSFSDNDNITNGEATAIVNGILTNVNFISGGEDAEDDEALRKRVLQRIRNQPAGGAKHDLKRWALEVSGVGDAWPLSNFPSPGWGTVIVKASGSTSVPSSTLLTEVRNYLTERIPVTADINVVAIDEVQVAFTIAIPSSESSLQSIVEGNIRLLLEEVGEPGVSIPIVWVYNAISSAGVSNYEIQGISLDSISQDIDDIVLTGYEYATLSTVTFNTL